MNYDKQKQISQEEMVRLNQDSNGKYRICQMNDYPNNNKYLEAQLNFSTGFDILYNADPYILKYVNRKSINQSENKWAVLANGGFTHLSLFEHNQEFDNVEDAVNHAYTCYSLALDEYYTKERDKLSMVIGR